MGLARINEGLEKCLYLGNLESKRDWGHAKCENAMAYVATRESVTM